VREEKGKGVKGNGGRGGGGETKGKGGRYCAVLKIP